MAHAIGGYAIFIFISWHDLPQEPFSGGCGSASSLPVQACTYPHAALCPHVRAHSRATNTEKQQDISQAQITLAEDAFPNFVLCPQLKSTISLLLFQNSGYPRRECAKTLTLLILIKSKSPFLRTLQAKQLSNTENGMKILSFLFLVPQVKFLLPLCLSFRLFLVCRCKNAKFQLLLISPKGTTLSSRAVTGADKGALAVPAGKDHVVAVGR